MGTTTTTGTTAPVRERVTWIGPWRRQYGGWCRLAQFPDGTIRLLAGPPRRKPAR